MRISFILFLINALWFSPPATGALSDWYLPIRVGNRQSLDEVRLTSIGEFGRQRQARTSVPAHLHTAIDLMRPANNYLDEPIFPAAAGVVISVRNDGPFAQVILEHLDSSHPPAWSVYEHLAEVKVMVGERVSPLQPIGRFFNRRELDKFGWQFDHLHFEILKKRPRSIFPHPRTPSRLFAPYSLECYTQTDLDAHYYNPADFFQSRWGK